MALRKINGAGKFRIAFIFIRLYAILLTTSAAVAFPILYYTQLFIILQVLFKILSILAKIYACYMVTTAVAAAIGQLWHGAYMTATGNTYGYVSVVCFFDAGYVMS